MAELMNFPAAPDAAEHVTRYFDALAAELGGDGYSLFKLTIRYLNYYAERVPHFTNADRLSWQGECPLCGGHMAIDALSGWWRCQGCRRQGEMYTLEYLLHGDDNPASWETCRQRADRLMRGA